MGNIKDINIDLIELERDKKKNFEERMKFIDFWTEHIKKHSDKEWSNQQNIFLNNQSP